jgi:hypothetical protein
MGPKSWVTLIALLVATSGVSRGLQLDGRWRENQYQRTGLNDFLYAVGTGFFRRLYETSTSWENEQSIYQKGNVYKVYGFKGPNKDVYHHMLTADNTTQGTVDLGSMGGMYNSRSEEVDDESLVTYLNDPETNETEVISTRTKKQDSRLMIHELFHVSSNASYKSYYYRMQLV